MQNFMQISRNNILQTGVSLLLLHIFLTAIFLGHLIMPTNPPKHHDFNHQTPTKSNTKIWLQDSNKELELTERKRKKNAAKFQQAMKLSATENESGFFSNKHQKLWIKKKLQQYHNKHRKKQCKLLKFYAGLRMKLLQQLAAFSVSLDVIMRRRKENELVWTRVDLG